MAKVITTIAADNGMDFGSILSFKTKNYVGIWSYEKGNFVMLENSSTEFYLRNVGKDCESLQELDDEVFEEVNEHILEVFDKCEYTIELE